MREQARSIGVGIYGPEIGLRPSTPLHHWRINFVFNMGGMGDFVNFAAATRWVQDNCPWVSGRVVAPRYIIPLMRDIHTKWQCVASEDFAKHLEKGDAIIGPDVHINGINTSRQFLTVVGAHPVDVGFAYYAGTAPPPDDAFLPVLDYARARLPERIRNLERYAVLPVGNVQLSRRVTGKHLNPLINHLNHLNITPVFLGKRDMIGDGKGNIVFPDDIDYAAGVDLRDQTTVKEAAAIMQHAEFTAGLDTGLLHLAALMHNSRIIFAYNITSRAHREPRRNHGKTVHIELHDSHLQCAGCQSKLKHITRHTFDQCFYRDNLCVDLLFENDAERFKLAIEQLTGR